MNLSKLSTIDINTAAEKAENFTPSSGPLPADVYQVQIEKAEVKATNAGNGYMVKVQLRVKGGEFDNRVMFDSMLFEHPNPDAVEIGVSRLATLAKAAGLPSIPAEADAFLNKIVMADAYVGKEREYNGKKTQENEIGKYLIAQGVEQPKQMAPSHELPDDLPF